MRQRALAPLLIGRQPELAELDAFLDAARSGAGQVVMLAGEAGVGKSRLLREFARRHSGDASLDYLFGHCYDERPAPPYGPFVELLGRVERRSDTLTAHLLPVEVAPPPDGDAAGDGQTERRRLFHTIYQTLRPAPGRAHVLILEDLHWSDQATQDLLLYLARVVADDRVLIIGTYRTDEIHRLHPLATLIARLTRERRYHEVRLAPLSRAELAELLAATLGEEPPAILLADLYERTEGNPFFAEEVLSALLAAGPLPSGSARTPTLGALPISIKDSILRRIADLDAAAVAVARAAAVVGRRFDFELLLRLTGLDEAALLHSIAVLVERQLIVEEMGDLEDRYRFRHELIRQALYEEMLRRERRIRHLEVLRALEELHGPDDDAVVDQLAYHAITARATHEAARYSLRAAENAVRVHAYRDALGHFEAALEHGEPAGGFDERARAELLARMGHAAYQVTDPRRAADYWREAMVGYEALGDRRRAADVLRWLGRAAWDAGAHEEAFAQTQAALALLEGEGPSRELAMAYSAMSHLYMFRIFEGKAGAAEACIAWGQKALAMGKDLSDDGVVTHALNSIGVALTESGQLEAGIERLRLSLAVALQADLPADVVRAYVNLCGPLRERGLAEAGLALAQEGWAYAVDHDFIRGSGKLLLNLCYAEFETGLWPTLEERLAEVLRPGSPAAVEERTPLLLVRASLLIEQGRSTEARDLLEPILPAARTPGEAGHIEHLLIHVYEALGDLPRAMAAADSMLARAHALLGANTPLSSLGPRTFKLLGIAEHYLERGRRDEGLAIAEAIEQQIAANPIPRHLAIGAHLRGLAALAQPGVAAEHFNRSRSIYTELGFRPYALEQRRRRAASLLELATPAARTEAAAELAVARTEAVSLGAAYELARIVALEERLAPQAPGSAPVIARPRPIAGLTPRELEVLTLITRGLSNRAIAETLVISEKTAEVHVRNILGKLGFSSRTQAATYAVERGLVAHSA